MLKYLLGSTVFHFSPFCEMNDAGLLFFNVINIATKFLNRYSRETLGNLKSILIANVKFFQTLEQHPFWIFIFYPMYFISLPKSICHWKSGAESPKSYVFWVKWSPISEIRGSLISAPILLSLKNNGFTIVVAESSPE